MSTVTSKLDFRTHDWFRKEDKIFCHNFKDKPIDITWPVDYGPIQAKKSAREEPNIGCAKMIFTLTKGITEMTVVGQKVKFSYCLASVNNIKDISV